VVSTTCAGGIEDILAFTLLNQQCIKPLKEAITSSFIQLKNNRPLFDEFLKNRDIPLLWSKSSTSSK